MFNNELLKDMIGKTIIKIYNEHKLPVEKNCDEVYFETNNEIYKFYHEQACCESVYLEDIIGDLNDLLKSPILHAEEIVNDPSHILINSETWTFYILRTIKGEVLFRFYGTSNGYYSERISIEKISKE